MLSAPMQLSAVATHFSPCSRSLLPGSPGAGAALDQRAYAGVGIFEDELEVVQAHNGRHDAQPQSGTRNRTVALGSIEALQNRSTLVGGNARTVVLNDQLWSRRVFSDAHLYGAAVTTELDGIVDEITDRFEEQLRVGLDNSVGLGHLQQPDPGTLGQRAIQLGDTLDYPGQIYCAESRATLPYLELGHPQDAAEPLEYFFDPLRYRREVIPFRIVCVL